MRTAALALALLFAAPALAPAEAEAAKFSKAEKKAFEDEVKAAFPGKAWALKDLPIKSGMAMMVPFVAPIAEITPQGTTIDTTGVATAGFGAATTVWYGVRPYDTVELEEVDFDDDEVTLVFHGVGDSDGRDTEIAIRGFRTFTEARAAVEELVTSVDPVAANPDWPEEIARAIARRVLVNGMNKRQAYLVVGEPLGATVQDVDGKKVEIWRPRQSDGVKIGYAAAVRATGYPLEIRFEDGKLVNMGTSSTGGVSLD